MIRSILGPRLNITTSFAATAVRVFILCGLTNSASAGLFTNNTPTVTTTSTETILHMELNAYGRFGNPDGATDIAFTGDSNTWNFSIPGSVHPSTFGSAYFKASLALDDHYGVATSSYSFDVGTNGGAAYHSGSGAAGLIHGSPYASTFTNWSQMNFTNAYSPDTTSFSFYLKNTSSNTRGDWMAIDWIELHLVNTVDLASVAAVPEPSTLLPAGLGLIAVGAAAYRRRNSK